MSVAAARLERMTGTAILTNGRLESVDGERIDAILDGLARTRRQLAALHATEAALLAEALDVARSQSEAAGPSRVRDLPVRSMAAQIAVVLHRSDRTVQGRLDDASLLVTRFPATFAALAAGDIDRAHADVIVDAGVAIDRDDVRATYESAAIGIARRETPGRLRPAVRILAQRLHPLPLDERHAAASAERDVCVRDLDDGMAELIATLPAVHAHGIRDRLTQLARAVVDARSGGAANDADAPATVPADTRRLGEVRADVFTDLLLTGHASPEVSSRSLPESEAIVAHVQITVPVLTALGRDTTPAELVGRAPIDLGTALRFAGAATGWDRVLTHPVSGSVMAVDRYRPGEQLRRALRVRDEHCRFPGCRMPTRRCDIDHTVAREHDGPTELGNLAHLCRRHHVLKHHSAWRVRQRPDGVLEWTSPTGRVFADRPARTLVFTADSAPDERPHGIPADAPPERRDPPPF